MNKKLYIHIGTGKTGTTAIQNFLDNNDALLEGDFNIKYIDTYREDTNHHGLCSNYYRVVQKEKDPLNMLSKRLDELINEISSSNNDKYVISSEYFPGVTNEEINVYVNKLIKFVEINIIVYFRRQDLFLESWYSQLVKMCQSGSIQSLQNILDNDGFFDYFSLADKWRKHIGKDKIHVRAYEKKQFYKDNLLNDFMAILGIDELCEFEFHKKDYNPSLSRDQILLIKAFKKAKVENYLDDLLMEPFDFTPVNSQYFLSPEERTNLILKFDQSNAKVAELYLDRLDGKLFYDNLPFDNNEDWKDIEQPSVEYLVRAFIHLLSKQRIYFEEEINELKIKMSK